jgi:NitT/TauT family transport system ATP-binding protein
MIKFENVSKSFGGVQVLKNVSFKVHAHESVAVVGSSGSGKTTLLKLIAGTLQADSGSVTVESDRIGYVFQDHRLLPWKTALDNIMLVLRASGINDKVQMRDRAISWMKLMRLSGYYNYYPRQLSGGMMQRVSIARAFSIEPQIMLMDEPFSNLDTSLSDSLMRQLKQVLANYRTTTVYVTHDLVQALSIGQRIYKLSSAGLQEVPMTDRKKVLEDDLEQRLKGIIGY